MPAGLSLRDIARRAGVSPAAPYHHFSDKDALVAAVAGECAQLLLDALDAAVAEAGDDQRRRFQLTGIAFIRFAVMHPAHFRAMELPGMLAKMPAPYPAAGSNRSTPKRSAACARRSVSA